MAKEFNERAFREDNGRWMENEYDCPTHGLFYSQWACACDDECPQCGTVCEAKDSTPLVAKEHQDELMELVDSELIELPQELLEALEERELNDDQCDTISEAIEAQRKEPKRYPQPDGRAAEAMTALRIIADYPADSNSQPDIMGPALDVAQALASRVESNMTPDLGKLRAILERMDGTEDDGRRSTLTDLFHEVVLAGRPEPVTETLSLEDFKSLRPGDWVTNTETIDLEFDDAGQTQANPGDFSGIVERVDRNGGKQGYTVTVRFESTSHGFAIAVYDEADPAPRFALRIIKRAHNPVAGRADHVQ